MPPWPGKNPLVSKDRAFAESPAHRRGGQDACGLPAIRSVEIRNQTFDEREQALGLGAEALPPALEVHLLEADAASQREQMDDPADLPLPAPDDVEKLGDRLGRAEIRRVTAGSSLFRGLAEPDEGDLASSRSQLIGQDPADSAFVVRQERHSMDRQALPLRHGVSTGVKT